MTIRMKMFLLAATLAITATASHAAINQGGSTGTSFSCDVNTNTCACTGTWEGADCKAMRKNCVKNDGVTGGIPFNCTVNPGTCTCNMAVKTDSKKPLVERAPAVPAQK